MLSAQRLVAGILTLGLLGTAPTSAQSSFWLSFEGGKAFERALLNSSEQDLNCDVLSLQREALPLLIPLEVDADPVREAELRRLGKIVFETAFAAPSKLGDLVAKGMAVGLELDWFGPDPNGSPSAATLGPTIEIWSLDASGASVLRAVVHGYDAAGYTGRIDELENMVGHPVVAFPVWTGATSTSIGTKFSGIGVFGSANFFHGKASSFGALTAIGFGSAFLDGVESATSVWISSKSTSTLQRVVAQVTDPGTLIDEAAARAIALASGTYASGDLTLTDKDPDGFYFAEGDIRVKASGIRKTWTLVSASGNVSMKGTGNELICRDASTALIALAGSIFVTGDDNRINGELHAPAGLLSLAGHRNLLVGLNAAATVLVIGNGNVVSDGTHVEPAN